MKRFNLCKLQAQEFSKMSTLPPRKFSTSSRTSKLDSSPLQILLQMGFPRHRALKALAATGNRSVQLASDWLLTHVNDAFIDTDTPREYILYACPTGSLLHQLHDFWEKSKSIGGWNGAHNFPPHITLVSFFKAPDETSLQIAKAMKHVVDNVSEPPTTPLKLEPYMSHNFMGLFVSEEHAEYFKKIAVQYVKEVSSLLGVSMATYEHLDALGTCFPWCAMPQEKPMKTVSLEPHVKSLHITLAYHFDVTIYEELKLLVDGLQCPDNSSWELRLYSRDPRFAHHQVYKVTQNYSAKESDELELVLGDYVYVCEKDLDASTDGWVQGTSWLTGVTGFLPAVYTRRTPESDAWTLHRAIPVRRISDADKKSCSEGEMTTFLHEDAAELGREKSDEIFSDWHKYWQHVATVGPAPVLEVTSGNVIQWDNESSAGESESGDGVTKSATRSISVAGDEEESGKRWVFALRHGERVDLTYGNWTQHCFDKDGRYIRKDLNMPLTLGERAGGAEAYGKDTPLTRVGRLQAQLAGEALRLAGLRIARLYASCALRCVDTAQAFLEGHTTDPSVKICVEPGLFEYKLWHAHKGQLPFMTPRELHAAGFNVDLDYKPYVDLGASSSETLDEYYERGERVFHGAVTDNPAGNILFVGHAATLDMMSISLPRLGVKAEFPPYQISKNLMKVPYCALAAVRGPPYEVVSPPCPPCLNTGSGRFDWRLLKDLS